MTSKQQLQKLIALIRKPHTIFAVVAVAAAVFLTMLFAQVYFPVLQLEAQSGEQLERLQQERDTLSQSSVPASFNRTDADAWLRKVPVRDSHSKLLQSLLQVESTSGGSIERLEIGESQPESDLVDLLTQAQSEAEAANRGTGAKQAQQADPQPKSNGLVTERFTVHVTGTYQQITSFWALLTQMERMIVPTEWRLVTGSSSGSQGTGETAVRLEISFHTYTAPEFADLTNPDEVVAPDNPGRQDPTLTDSQFIEQLIRNQAKGEK